MRKYKGMVLVMVALFLLVMSLQIGAMLLVSQLSHKSASAGQEQLIHAYAGLVKHKHNLGRASEEESETLSSCPAAYAGFSEEVMKCELLQVKTEHFSANRHFFAGYQSVVIKQYLALEGK